MKPRCAIERRRLRWALPSAAAVVMALAVLGVGQPRTPGPRGEEGVTPGNWTLTPAGVQVPIGDRPLGAALSPDGGYLAVTNDGAGVQSIALLDTASRRVVQTVPYHTPEGLFVGVTWSPDGRRLFASAGGNNRVRAYDVRNGLLVEGPSIMMGEPSAKVYPAGLAMTADGRTLLVVENLANRLAAVDPASGAVGATAATGRLPYAVAILGDKAYVSNWGAGSVTAVRLPSLAPAATIAVGLHPAALAADPARARLYVANTDDDTVSVIDTRTDRVIATPSLAPYRGAPEGSVPDGLAVSPDGRRLFVANAGNNDVAVVDLTRPAPAVLGLIPTAWYPTTVTLSHDGQTLFITNAKGLGAGPNPRGPVPTRGPAEASEQYIAQMITGTVAIVPVPAQADLDVLTAHVVRNNGVNEAAARLGGGAATAAAHAIPRRVGEPSLIKHVIYVIKENRTYDQVLGDLPGGDGDARLTLFGRDVAPNHHRLAEAFVLLDHFYADAEVSADGHNWSTAGMTNDYVQKNWPATYSNRGRGYDYEGGEPAAYPRGGFLWDAATRAGVTYRVYGEFTEFMQYPSRGTMAALERHVAPTYHGWDLHVPDQTRIDEWLAEFRGFERGGALPQLTIMRLPNDHTAGTRRGYPTPQAMVADNDLALGRLVEAVGRSRFWKDTLIIAVEDDAQDGPDHIDAHRTVALLAGAYVRRHAVDHTFYSTASLLRTIDLILGIPSTTQYELAATPLLGAITDTPVPYRYAAARPRQSLTAMNPPDAPGAAASSRLDLRRADETPPGVLDRILWQAVKGPIPLPRTPYEIR
ncbi:MAG TPA: bifunctional YncE family protein/alkaline phosphatase family protein [bacterium]|nr:bifunctional YncE family protein/alkaline phosphatase family protein [bacterium]